jgi:ATPase subunit of ABC transporter with duplicated ATPase domains
VLKDILKKRLIDKLIPWFIKYIWPEISKAIKIYVIEYGAKLLKYIMGWLKEFFRKQSETKQIRQEYAKQKYEEASQQATVAKNPEEVDKYRVIAEIWREVFEQFREENEQLKADLAEATELIQNLSSKMKSDVETDMDRLGVDSMMKSKIDNLPELPLPLERSKK